MHDRERLRRIMWTKTRYIISLFSSIWLVFCISSCYQVYSMKAAIPEHNLNIMLVVSFGQFGFNSSGVVPAANIALEDINKDPGVLPGYRLTYDRVRDSQVSPVNYSTRAACCVHACSTKLFANNYFLWPEPRREGRDSMYRRFSNNIN